MSSPQNHTKTPTQQDCLAEWCFQLGKSLCRAWGDGSFLTTLLDNWNTGTMSPLRRKAKFFTRQDCLAKRTFKSGEGLREARSGGSFPTTLLDNWNTGTLLSPHRLQSWLANVICLAGQRFSTPTNCQRGVAAFPFSSFFENLDEGQGEGLLQFTKSTG